MACRSCICTYPQLKEVVIGALMEHRVLQKQRGSVGAGSCAESGSNLDLILQLLIVASHIFFSYKAEARTQQEKAQDFLLGRMLYWASGSQVLCIAYFMVLLEWRDSARWQRQLQGQEECISSSPESLGTEAMHMPLGRNGGFLLGSSLVCAHRPCWAPGPPRHTRTFLTQDPQKMLLLRERER